MHRLNPYLVCPGPLWPGLFCLSVDTRFSQLPALACLLKIHAFCFDLIEFGQAIEHAPHAAVAADVFGVDCAHKPVGGAW
jgi:hypothetical protein